MIVTVKVVFMFTLNNVYSFLLNGLPRVMGGIQFLPLFSFQFMPIVLL